MAAGWSGNDARIMRHAGAGCDIRKTQILAPHLSVLRGRLCVLAILVKLIGCSQSSFV